MDDTTLEFISTPATTQYIPPAPSAETMKTEICIGIFLTVALIVFLYLYKEKEQKK